MSSLRSQRPHPVQRTGKEPSAIGLKDGGVTADSVPPRIVFLRTLSVSGYCPFNKIPVDNVPQKTKAQICEEFFFFDLTKSNSDKTMSLK